MILTEKETEDFKIKIEIEIKTNRASNFVLIAAELNMAAEKLMEKFYKVADRQNG